MTEPVIQALVFDIGRVIVRVNVKRALATLGTDAGLSPEQVWEAIQTDPRWQDWQEGRVQPQEWHEHLARRFRFGLTFEQFCGAWNSALDPETILEEGLFRRLAQRHRLVLLSNTDPIHVAHMEAHFTFVRHFAGRVYSCRVGTSKPAAAIYRKAIEQAAASPERTLYVDDVQEYVEAARRVGLQAVLFQGPGQLLIDLRERRILQP